MLTFREILRGEGFQVVLLLILSVSMVSSASILIRFSVSPPLVIVFWRTLLGAIVMALVGLARRDYRSYSSETLRLNWRWLIGIGIVLSMHFSTWFTSLFLTTVAASVVLVNTSPILTGILSTFLLGESLRRQSWVGIIVAVSGAVFLAWTDLAQSGFGAFQGDLLALLSALFLAIYFIGGRQFAIGLPITIYTTIVYLSAAMCTLIICMLSGINVIVSIPSELFIFLALAIFPTALGHSVNNYLLTIVPAHVVSSAVLGEPVGATILAAIFLQEVPPPSTLLGFGVILLGIGIVLTDLTAQQDSEDLSFDDPYGS